MKKKIAVILLVLLLGLIPASATAAPSILIDGKFLSLDVPPQIQNNRLMVPMAVIFKELGAEVTWIEATQSIQAKKGDISILLQVDNPEATINGQKMPLDCQPMIVDGRTLVPLSFVAKSLGAEVLWNAGTETVSIISAIDNTETAMTPKEIKEKVDKAVLLVGIFDGNQKLLRYGNGIVVSSRGKILLPYDMLRNGYWAVVVLGEDKYSAIKSVSGYDKNTNAALLRLNPVDFPSVSNVILGDSDKLQSGDKVICIGCSRGFENTMTEGVIGAKREFDGKKLIQLSVAISPESLGVYVFNMKGELVGLVRPELTAGKEFSFAVPINEIKETINKENTYSISEAATF